MDTKKKGEIQKGTKKCKLREKVRKKCGQAISSNIWLRAKTFCEKDLGWGRGVPRRLSFRIPSSASHSPDHSPGGHGRSRGGGENPGTPAPTSESAQLPVPDNALKVCGRAPVFFRRSPTRPPSMSWGGGRFLRRRGVGEQGPGRGPRPVRSRGGGRPSQDPTPRGLSNQIFRDPDPNPFQSKQLLTKRGGDHLTLFCGGATPFEILSANLFPVWGGGLLADGIFQVTAPKK